MTIFTNLSCKPSYFWIYESKWSAFGFVFHSSTEFVFGSFGVSVLYWFLLDSLGFLIVPKGFLGCLILSIHWLETREWLVSTCIHCCTPNDRERWMEYLVCTLYWGCETNIKNGRTLRTVLGWIQRLCMIGTQDLLTGVYQAMILMGVVSCLGPGH